MLTKDELIEIEKRLNRKPNYTEEHVFDAMWSEHCSYKTSKPHLKRLYTNNKYVYSGPGENAGVINIGDGDKIAFKIESHNHPSYIEPFQGAATGVGGILRDIFTMGARPIANLNSLYFGEPNNKKTNNIIESVVAGISHYGNCIGVPTVSSKITFADCYEKNPLVNAMNVGYTKGDIFTSISNKKGKVYYVGAKTGRDGIGGAIMASEKFEDGEDKRPTVQVGDPYFEKLLLEACLELFNTGCVIAAQDMGAAGLTSSTTEIAIKSKYGIFIDVAKVPLREELMEPWEILLSESQERMLFVLDDEKLGQHVYDIFDKWDLECIEIGSLIDEQVFKVVKDKKTYVDIPLSSLDYQEIHREVKPIEKYRVNFPLVVSDFNMNWVWEQYDSEVMGNTIKGITENVAIVRIPNSKKAIAITTNSNPYHCYVNPYNGIRFVINEIYESLCNVKSKPIAITNCLNFGNPENPEIMWEFIQTIDGMKDICEKLDFPVVSGNVSFYNETSGNNIMPTPVIGAVGLIEDYNNV